MIRITDAAAGVVGKHVHLVELGNQSHHVAHELPVMVLRFRGHGAKGIIWRGGHIGIIDSRSAQTRMATEETLLHQRRLDAEDHGTKPVFPGQRRVGQQQAAVGFEQLVMVDRFVPGRLHVPVEAGPVPGKAQVTVCRVHRPRQRAHGKVDAHMRHTPRGQIRRALLHFRLVVPGALVVIKREMAGDDPVDGFRTTHCPYP